MWVDSTPRLLAAAKKQKALRNRNGGLAPLHASSHFSKPEDQADRASSVHRRSSATSLTHIKPLTGHLLPVLEVTRESAATAMLHVDASGMNGRVPCPAALTATA